MSGPEVGRPAGRVTPAAFEAALRRVRERIGAAGGKAEELTIVGVTKGHGPEAVETAVAAGITDIGENYPSELRRKAEALDTAALTTAGAVCWHFVGTVQRNKVRSISDLVALWHAVDRVEEAERIGACRPGARVMVEVAIAPGPGRGGCPPEATSGLVGAIRSAADVEVVGLMAVGPPGPPELARPGFRWVASEARRLGLPDVSMGMSADLEVAVQEGTTMLRLGTVLFGPRPGAENLER